MGALHTVSALFWLRKEFVAIWEHTPYSAPVEWTTHDRLVFGSHEERAETQERAAIIRDLIETPYFFT